MTGPDDPRRDAILKAAAELFFRHGFAETSIDAIIERVGGSKRTIYSLFGSKTGLFEAIVRRNSAQMFSEPGLEDGSPHSIDAALEGFAIRLLDLLSQPRTIDIYRIVTAEAARFPDLGRTFFDQGPRRGRQWLAETLRAADREGVIAVPDPDLAASQFLGLVRSDLMFELLLGLRQPPDEAEIRRMAREATRVFLDGIRRG